MASTSLVDLDGAVGGIEWEVHTSGGKEGWQDDFKATHEFEKKNRRV